MSNSSAFTIVRDPVDGVTPIKYSCTQLMADNQAYALRIEYYYDILYHSGTTEEEAVKEGEAALLKSVAGNFGLVDGARCQIPPVQTLWLIEATSDPMDQSVNFSKFSATEALTKKNRLFFLCNPSYPLFLPLLCHSSSLLLSSW